MLELTKKNNWWRIMALEFPDDQNLFKSCRLIVRFFLVVLWYMNKHKFAIHLSRVHCSSMNVIKLLRTNCAKFLKKGWLYLTLFSTKLLISALHNFSRIYLEKESDLKISFRRWKFIVYLNRPFFKVAVTKLASLASISTLNLFGILKTLSGMFQSYSAFKNRHLILIVSDSKGSKYTSICKENFVGPLCEFRRKRNVL